MLGVPPIEMRSGASGAPVGIDTMDKPGKRPLSMAQVQAKLSGARGKKYWRCLEELAETPEFMDFLVDEVPQQTRAIATGLDRRQFLTLAGASLAMAGMSGCRFLPDQKVVPYVSQPEDLTPGLPLTFATSVLRGGYATGVLGTSREYRPVKLEGNPDHPASFGASDAYTQAELLNLYDPDRSQSVVEDGKLSDWGRFNLAIAAQLANLPADGAGLRILSTTVTSPSLNDQLVGLLKKYPAARWHQYEPTGKSSSNVGTGLAFGESVSVVYNFAKADRIVSLDADFLLTMVGSIKYARDFAEKRRVHQGAQTMNRLYVVESTPTITGAMADNQFPVKPSEVLSIAQHLAAAVGVASAPGAQPAPDWIAAVAKDLADHKGASIIIPGDEQSPAIHYLAHAMNVALGNVGTTVNYVDLLEYGDPKGDQLGSIKSLADDVKAGAVKILVLLGGNPVYDAPSDLDFKALLKTVPLRIRLGLYENETSEYCHWHLPATHDLESWADAHALDGTTSIIQPLVSPLYDGKSAGEVVSILRGDMLSGYEVVHRYWADQGLPGNFEKTFQTILHDGLIKDSAAKPKNVVFKPGVELPAAPAASGIELVFRPDQTILDGHFSNNGWMQELPKQLTKITWDNAALMSPATAAKLNLVPSDFLIESDQKDAKVVEIKSGAASVKAPVQIIPGHPDDSITLNFGYGRSKAGQIGNEIGANAYLLRTTSSPGYATGVQVTDTGATYPLSHTRAHYSMEKRDIVMEATFEEWVKKPDFAKTESTTNPPKDKNLYAEAQERDHKYEGFGAYKWGMSIDNNVCIGCQACVTACQAENNIPVVGKDQVSRGREMHWIRIDRYYKGDLKNPQTFFEPVPCMHCELAPCEPVCPVAATTHSHEGLNQMIYNRCVGTKYCSDNCPYKVRRFNFYKYSAGQPWRPGTNYDLPVLKLSANPEVTIRGRGIMEKCTYCVQRIDAARQTAKVEEREIRDGEVVTACQQACPTNAIVFGNLSDKESAVSKLKDQPHDYSLLGELGTRPRTTYLAKISNPNPDIRSQRGTERE